MIVQPIESYMQQSHDSIVLIFDFFLKLGMCRPKLPSTKEGLEGEILY